MYHYGSKKAISRQTVCLTDSKYYYILEESGSRDKIEFERYVGVYIDNEKD